MSTEHFIQNFCIENSPAVIIVVGELSSEEELMINYIKSQMHTSDKFNRKVIIILHNFKEIVNYSNLEKKANLYIQDNFKVTL